MAKDKSFSLEIDSKTFSARSKKFLVDLDKEEKQFIREQSSFLARDLAKFTPPYASYPTTKGNSVGSAKDIKQGKVAIAIGMFSICQPRKRKTITWARKAFGNGPIFSNGRQIGHGVIDDLDTLAQWHKRNRDNRGRTKRVAQSDRPFVFAPILNKFIKIRQADVGIAKASFYKASLQLGGKHNAVKAIKMGLMKTTGSGSQKKTSKGYEGAVNGSAKGAFHTTKHMPKIQKDRTLKALRRLKYIAAAEAKKSSLNEG